MFNLNSSRFEYKNPCKMYAGQKVCVAGGDRSSAPRKRVAVIGKDYKLMALIRMRGLT